MSMFFKVEGFGNYSESFGWDEGLNLSDPVHVTKADIEEMHPGRAVNGFYYINLDKAKCPEVQTMYENQHGGSREVTLLVKAMGYSQAAERAREYADALWPCIGFEKPEPVVEPVIDWWH